MARECTCALRPKQLQDLIMAASFYGRTRSSRQGGSTGLRERESRLTQQIRSIEEQRVATTDLEDFDICASEDDADKSITSPPSEDISLVNSSSYSFDDGRSCDNMYSFEGPFSPQSSTPLSRNNGRSSIVNATSESCYTPVNHYSTPQYSSINASTPTNPIQRR